MHKILSKMIISEKNVNFQHSLCTHRIFIEKNEEVLYTYYENVYRNGGLHCGFCD